MKKNLFVIVFLLIVNAVILSACGGEASPEIPSRQVQLLETHLFSPHLLCGVSTEREISGEFQAGFNLLFGTANGEVASTSIMTLKLQNKDGRQYFSNIPRSMIILNQSSENTETTVELQFKKSWLEGGTSYETDSENRVIETDTFYYSSFGNNHEYRTYTEGSIMNPNNFIVPENLYGVVITYPATGMTSTCWTQP